jgi:hypothetical protein|tara:strand:- start:601 stop:783 length:183 start_codon:yes stop_codon:yes gene_type:complete
MKIRITFNLDSETREAINSFYGEEGLASYEDCKTWIKHTVDNDLEVVGAPLSWSEISGEE